MFLRTFLSDFRLTFAICLELVRRQQRDELYEVIPESQIKKANIVSIQTLPPQINKNAIRKQIRFGPYLVPGSNVS
jgi:hypothetical protein